MVGSGTSNEVALKYVDSQNCSGLQLGGLSEPSLHSVMDSSV